MRRFYVELEQIYAKVESQTPKFEGNPCGECHYCCTAVLESHNVTDLEYEFLAHQTGLENSEKFRSYIDRKTKPDGELLYQQCPYYDKGCTVHSIRPLSCRLFGIYQIHNEVLPTVCVFNGKTIIIPEDDAQNTLPGNRELQVLATTHLSYSGVTDRPPRTPRPPRRRRSGESHLGKVMRMQVEGRYQEALLICKTLTRQEPNALHFEIQAEILEALNRYPEACESYRQALTFTPDNAQMFFRLASASTWAGQLEEAKVALNQCLEINPLHLNATGFLGVVSSIEEDWERAREHFQKALKLANGVSAYNFQMACVHERLGELELAKEQFLIATTFPSTQEPAQEALLRLGG